MGGLLILIALSVATLLWADLTNRYVWCVLGITVTFGAIGLWDDFLKVSKRNPKGVPGKVKLALAVLIAGVGAWFIAQGSPPPLRYTLALPFLKDVLVPLGIVGFLAFSVLVIVGTSNAVNLTDGLDGLAIGPVIMAAGVFALITYIVGNAIYTNYLYVHHVPRAGELSVLLAALVGAGLGFCGSMRRPPWCSWATPARCRSAARWAASRSSPSMRSFSRSSAACSCSRPFR
jgi:phospho-N-acetylmuramoyl-pentapeptide-transferase